MASGASFAMRPDTYVAAPRTTFDFSLADGSGIPIEERDPAEVTHGFGPRTAPPGVKVFSPAFDVTPARYITGFFTDAGLLSPPYGTSLSILRDPAVERAPAAG